MFVIGCIFLGLASGTLNTAAMLAVDVYRNTHMYGDVKFAAWSIVVMCAGGLVLATAGAWLV